MKIAFASEHPNQIRAFSGTPCYMFQALHAASESLTYIETPGYDLETIMADRDKGIGELKGAGEYLSSKLEQMDVDIVICQGSSMIPFLRTDKPVVLWHDATWLGLMQTSFEEFRDKYPFLYEWDCMMLERCDLILFAADWVRDQTLSYYRTDPHKVHIVPFGANMLTQPLETVETYIHHREQSPCELTFIAVDWKGKGLPLAYEVMVRLNESGRKAVLNVIGTNVDRVNIERKIKHYVGYGRFTALDRFRLRFHGDKNVNKVGFLRKDDPVQYQRLCDILQRSHFLLHPASFECFGIAVVEANAFGVPVIGTNKYGLKTTVKNGLNGFLFEPGEYVERATTIIQHHMDNYEQYQALALGSSFEQQAHFDWTRSVQKLCEILSSEGLIPRQSALVHT